MRLTDDQVRDQLAVLNGWDKHGESISRTFSFADFKEAIIFVNKAAEAAEEMDHHPDILITYNTVQISVFTHSEGGLTSKDFTLAKKLNQQFSLL